MVAGVVYKNINESVFVFKTDNYSFFFSSKFNLERFTEKHKENRESLKYNFESRFRITMLAIDYFDFILYSKIEKRGFKVVSKDGEVLTCLELLRLDGEIKTLKSCKDL